MRRVVIHVDRLRLRGFRHEERHAMASGLQAQLARAFADSASLRHFGAARGIPHLRPGPVRMQTGATSLRVGAAVARAILEKMEK